MFLSIKYIYIYIYIYISNLIKRSKKIIGVQEASVGQKKNEINQNRPTQLNPIRPTPNQNICPNHLIKNFINQNSNIKF